MVTFKLIEPPFKKLDFKVFKQKLICSYELIVQNNIQSLLLAILFIRGAPSLIESLEYYYTEFLGFTNLIFGLKNISMTIFVILAVLTIKYQLIQSYKKFTIILMNFVIIVTSGMSIFIFSQHSEITREFKYVLAFTREMLFNFAIESLVIILFNLYITFCPKEIESTFSTFYLTVVNFGLEGSNVLSNIILKYFDITQEKNFADIEFLIIFNILFLLIGFLWISLMKMPTKKGLQRHSVRIMEIETEREIIDSQFELELEDIPSNDYQKLNLVETE